MSTNEMQRGYDDTGYLSEMAAGLLTRKYASVDEAARSILNEEAGSNVDRLRRKFREQGWHEKGLAAHVESVIASRRLIVEPGYHAIARRLFASVLHPLASLRKATASISPLKSARPGMVTMMFSVVTAALLAASSIGLIETGTAALTALIASTLILFAWADRASEEADTRSATAHLSGMAAVTAFAVAVFGHGAPNSAFLLGSSEGTIVTAIGLTAMGVYATSFIGTKTRRSGTRQNLEVGCLIAAITVISQIGTALLVHDGVVDTSTYVMASLSL